MQLLDDNFPAPSARLTFKPGTLRRLGSVISAGLLLAASASPAQQPEYKVTDRGADYRVWTGQTHGENHSYLELAGGMNYLKDGQWTESKEIIEPSPEGAIARQGQHQVVFANNLNSTGAIDLKASDGKRFRSNVLGLRYFDAASGKTVMIAEVKDSIGKITAQNQVTYDDAFKGVKADVRYTYTRAGFEQDIILREQPPKPELFDLNPETTRLQVVTEFLNPPEPAADRHERQLKNGTTMADETLDFGMMTIGRGKAFDLGNTDRRNGVSVAKQWVSKGNRDFLIEEVALPDLKGQLEALPQRIQPIVRLDSHEIYPAARMAQASPRKAMEVAESSKHESGLVLDYLTLGTSYSSFTLTNGSTYYVSGQTIMSTLTIQGGAVVKYAVTNGQNIYLAASAVNCQTEPYRPAIFTSENDNSVGDIIAGSAGEPSVPFFGAGLFISGSTYNANLHNLRFCYLNEGIYFQPEYGSVLTVLDSQFFGCGYGIVFDGITPTTLYAGNVLMDWLDYGVYTTNIVNAILDYVTADQVSSLVISGETQYGSLTMSNSILANVSSVANSGLPVTAGNNGFWNTSITGFPYSQAGSTPFQSVAMAGHYLANPGTGPFAAMGFPSTNATVAESLRHKTTIAPQLLSGTISSSLPLPPLFLSNPGSTAAPDLGYHYDVLDYVAATNTIQNATVSLYGGAAVGVWGTQGFILGGGAVLDSEGTPTVPNRIDSCLSVMESVLWVYTPSSSAGSAVSIASGTPSPAPIATNNFTYFETPAGAYTHFQGGGPGTYYYTSCQFSGGHFYNGTLPGSTTATITATNCLWEYVSEDLYYRPPASLYLFNNLFKGGALSLAPPSSGAFHLYNNLIDSATITEGPNGSDANYNAYISGQARITPNGANDVVISSADYQTNVLGYYYYPSAGNNLFKLVNAGSDLAPIAGVANYTTQTNQIPEGTTTNDIGFHYLAMPNYGSTGADGWLMFFNQFFGGQASVDVMSQTTTTGAILMPSLNFAQPFTVQAGSVVNIVLPDGAIEQNFNIVEDFGIRVVAQQPVSAVALETNYDYGPVAMAYLNYPSTMLGTNYVLVGRKSSDDAYSDVPRSQFSVVATADKTQVTIIPSPYANFIGFPGTSPINVTLQQGQTFELQTQSPIYTETNDVTGTMVTANLPVQVIAGASIAQVPNDIFGGPGQPLENPQLPVNAWESWALGVPFAPGQPNGDVFRVVAAYTNTAVYVNGLKIATLNAGQFYEIFSDTNIEVTATAPIQLAHFAAIFNENGILPPFETILPAPAQYVTNCTLDMPSVFGVFAINLMVPQSAISSTYINGVLATAAPYNANFQPINNSGYDGAQIALPNAPGKFTITSSQPVGVEAIAWSDFFGIGYIGGRSTATLAAAPDVYHVVKNTATTLNVTNNDTIPSASGLSLTIPTGDGPSHGTASIISPNQIRYTPTTGFAGTDQLTYQISELGLSSTATVSLFVNTNKGPIATNQIACWENNVNGVLTISVLPNDYDPDGNSLSVAYLSPANGGDDLLNPNQTISYTLPALDAFLPDSFTYTVTDGQGGTATGTVFISPLTAPDIGTDASVCSTMNSPQVINVASYDTDISGAKITITTVGTPQYGNVNINSGSQSVTYTPTNPNVLPANGGPGFDQFTYTVTDGACTESGTVYVYVNPQPNVSITLGGPSTIYEGVTGFGIPVGGLTWFTVTRDGPNCSSLFDTILIGGDGTGQTDSNPCDAVYPRDFYQPTNISEAPFPNGFYFTFQPGQSSVTFYIQTKQSNSGCPAPQTLLITNGGGAFNINPSAAFVTASVYPDPVITNPDGPYSTPLYSPITISVLNNDTDSHGTPLTVSAVTQGTYGSVVINSGSKTVTYTPTAHNAGGLTDTFTYTAFDGQFSCTATVTVQIQSVVQLGVSLSGPEYIYKGYTGFGIPQGGLTWFTLTREGSTTGTLSVPFFLGGNGQSSGGGGSCYAQSGTDFSVSGTGVQAAPCTDCFTANFSSGESTITVYAQTLDTYTSCVGPPYIPLIFTTLSGSGYVIDPTAPNATAYIYPDPDQQ